MATYFSKTPKQSWKEILLHKLQERNVKECHYFQALIAAHNKLFETADVLKHDNLQLTVQNEQLRSGFGDSINNIYKGGTQGVNQNENVKLLETKIFKLQEELTEVHRRKEEVSQQLSALRISLQNKETELAASETKVKDYELIIALANNTQKSLEQSLQDLEATNQMLKDEHQALQLAFNGIQEKYRNVQDENRELVDRWMKEKARDADKLNAENEYFVSQNLKKLQKDLDEAARDPTTVNVDTSAKNTPIENILQFTIPTKIMTKLEANDGEVLAVKWAPRGKYFISGGTDRKVKIWEINKDSAELRGVLRGSNAAVTSVEFNSEEDLILGTSNDFASRVWTVNDQRLRHTLTGHSGRVMAAKFLCDSSKVVSGSHDRTIKLWDLRNLACTRTIFTGSSCNDVVTDRPGTMIISGHYDKRIRLWDVRKESTADDISLQGKITSLDISPDGQYLLTCVRDNSLKLLDLRMNHVINTFRGEGFWVQFDYIRAVFTPDGRYVTAGSQDGTIFIWKADDCTKLINLREHNTTVLSCSWQPTGSILASCDTRKQVILWSP